MHVVATCDRGSGRPVDEPVRRALARFLARSFPRERPASSPPRVDPVAASILDAHGSWRRLVTARAERLISSRRRWWIPWATASTAQPREKTRASSSPLIDTAGPHAIRHNFWSDERYLTRARFGLELLPSLAEFDAQVITREIGDGTAGDVADAENTRRCASKFPNASPPSYPRSSPTTWTGNASTRRRVWTVYDERTRRIWEVLDALDVVGEEISQTIGLRELNPATVPSGERRAQPPALLGENDRHRR